MAHLPETHPPRQRSTRRVGLSLNTDGGANPADSAGANINKIVAQYRKTGTLPTVSSRNPLYPQYTFPTDLHEMREAVDQAQDRFNQLPADVRTLCENDWVNFLTLYNDEDGRKELLDAGLKVQIPVTNSPDPEPTTNPNPETSTTEETTSEESTEPA